MALLAHILPCIPRGPMFSSYEDGTIPIPMSVTSTGARRSLAKAITSSEEFTAPPPTSSTGLLASEIHLTASGSLDRSSSTGFIPYSSSR